MLINLGWFISVAAEFTCISKQWGIAGSTLHGFVFEGAVVEGICSLQADLLEPFILLIVSSDSSPSSFLALQSVPDLSTRRSREPPCFVSPGTVPAAERGMFYKTSIVHLFLDCHLQVQTCWCNCFIVVPLSQLSCASYLVNSLRQGENVLFLEWGPEPLIDAMLHKCRLLMQQTSSYAVSFMALTQTVRYGGSGNFFFLFQGEKKRKIRVTKGELLCCMQGNGYGSCIDSQCASGCKLRCRFSPLKLFIAWDRVYLRGPSLPVISTHLIHSGRMGACFGSFSPIMYSEIRMALTLLAFPKALKAWFFAGDWGPKYMKGPIALAELVNVSLISFLGAVYFKPLYCGLKSSAHPNSRWLLLFLLF